MVNVGLFAWAFNSGRSLAEAMTMTFVCRERTRAASASDDPRAAARDRQCPLPGHRPAVSDCKMADRGQISGGMVDGPLAFDTAVSTAAAVAQQIISPVAGQADILAAPDLEAGSLLIKQLEYLMLQGAVRRADDVEKGSLRDPQDAHGVNVPALAGFN